MKAESTDAESDVSRTIEFSRDRWRMSRVPWALLILLAGLCYAIYFDPRPSARELLIALLFIAALFVGRLLAELVLEAMFSFDLADIRQLAGAIVVLTAIGLVLAWLIISAGGSVKSPTEYAGWIVVCLTAGWIGHTLYRHVRPERPQLAFSPDGLGYRVPGAVDVLIPWREVEHVGSLAQAGLWQTGGAESGRGPTVFHVSRTFYDRHIHVRHLLLRGPDWESVFAPVDESIRVVLHHDPFSVEAKDIRGPLEARWKAFRDDPAPSVPAVGGRAAPAKDRHVVGRWSWESYWDLMPFQIPLAGILLVLMNAIFRD